MALSKSRRFEIFKRDSFTCQYCGRRPDDGVTVLEVDHIHPRAHGGSDDEMNLVTSCAECNRGKAAKLLAEVAPKPDADARMLELLQETAEHRGYQAALRERQIALEDTIALLQNLWTEYSGLGKVPSAHVLAQFLAKYDPSIVEVAICTTAPKVATGYVEMGSWIPYAWAVMRNTAEQDPANPLPYLPVAKPPLPEARPLTIGQHLSTILSRALYIDGCEFPTDEIEGSAEHERLGLGQRPNYALRNPYRSYGESNG